MDGRAGGQDRARLKGIGGLVLASPFVGVQTHTGTCDISFRGGASSLASKSV